MFDSTNERSAFVEHVKATLAKWLDDDPGLAPLDIEEEADHLLALLDIQGDAAKEPKLPFGDYRDPKLEGIGGSGIVVSAEFKPQRVRRAIKVPRLAIYTGTPIDGQVEPIDPEIRALSLVSHEAITRLHDATELQNGRGWCIITQLVEDPIDLAQFAVRCSCSEDGRTSFSAFEMGLMSVSRVIQDITRALVYLHEEARLLHFDIKPANLLVSRVTGKAYVTDLGFARELDKYAEDESVEVGFTAPYAHPALSDPRAGLIISRNYNKSRNELRGRDLGARFDLFAFGRTLQEILERISAEYGRRAHTAYTFTYLHLIACLCLDGKNAAGPATGAFASDTTLGLPVSLLKSKKFESFARVEEALERLLGQRRVELEIPELDPWAPSTINVSDHGVTPLTDRVKRVINHPVFVRLKSESQLGILEDIYPNANHTRYQHALGVFHAAREYLLALYYDGENPTFRVLFDADASRQLLIAALVHDLGQTSFFHELEELDSSFSHEQVTSEIVRKSTAEDEAGQTLRQIIEGDARDCWNVDAASLVDLMAGERLDGVRALMHDILDSHIDADKFDYLLRDSVEARVPYGHGIDLARFLRSLTTASDNVGRLTLAILEKGSASAEGFALARYQLYQAVYWHHSFRAVKAMFMTAASMIMDAVPRGLQLTMGSGFADVYFKRVVLAGHLSKSLPPTSKPRRARRDSSVGDRIERLLASVKEVPSPHPHADEPTIRFFWSVGMGLLQEGRQSEAARTPTTDDENAIQSETVRKAIEVLEDLMRRRFYKRVLEIPVSELSDGGTALHSVFSDRATREAFAMRVSEALKDKLVAVIQAESNARSSLTRDRVLDRALELCGNKVPFIVDLPTRGWLSGGDAPLLVADAKRRYFRSLVANRTERERAVWTAGVTQLMKQVAMLRIFAEPEIHEVLTSVMNEDQVVEALSEIRELRSLRRSR